MGLPQVGKSTYLTQLLKFISELEGQTVLFIPNQNFSEQDYSSIFQTEKYKQIIKKKHILGLDNFEPQQNYQAFFPNAALCIIPKGLTNPYSSEFIIPLNEYETNQFINQIKNVEIDIIVIKTIVQYSSGIPRLAEKLLDYFISHKNLSIKNILEDTDIQKDLNRIYDNFLMQIENNVFKLWIGLISVGKPLSAFTKSIGNKIESSSFTLLQKLGFDRIVQSPLLLTFFRNKIGENAVEDFRREGIKEFTSEKNKKDIGIWTANNEFKFFEPNSNILNIASSIFKSETLINRIDWEKSLIDNKPIVSKKMLVSFGSEVRFILGKRSEQKSRTTSYKKINKIYKEWIFKGDNASKKGHFEDAEKYYKETDNLTYDSNNKFAPDSNYGKVRLANLFRLQGKLDESINICKPIIRSTPNPHAYLCLGICEFWKGNFAESIECFDKCLIYKPNYINAILWEVRVLLHYKNFDIAGKLLKKIKINTLTNDNTFIYLMLNYLLFSQKEFMQITKVVSWRNKAFYFISDNKKQLPSRQIPLINLYLNSIENIEREFEELKLKFSTTEFSRGIEIDIFWWKDLFQND